MRYTVELAHPADFVGWRAGARKCLAAGIAPADILWRCAGDASGDLFDHAEPAPALPPDATVATVPAGFLPLAARLVCHSDPRRFDLAYRLLRRLQAEPQLLSVLSDLDVHRAHGFSSSVSRDMHKMKAFLRFRQARDEHGPIFLGWFEPAHHILDAVAPFFVRRFANQRWAILTPGRSAHWNGETLLVEASAATKGNIPAADALEDYWRTYFASIFNPARLKIAAMQREMPKKYWPNLPEARLIAPLISAARERTDEMIAKPATLPRRRIAAVKQDVLPSEIAEIGSIAALAEAARSCKQCPLWGPATQTVFGQGPATASLMLVGEQPGDQEDLAGEPFVGPAGELVDRALAAANIDRGRVYVTNAVKHFKFTPRGKRRLHQKPNTGEVKACRFWLENELRLVAPKVVVALGATAAQSVLNRSVRLMQERGEPIPGDNGETVMLTVHPSYLLRLPDKTTKDAQYAAFVADLKRAAELTKMR